MIIRLVIILPVMHGKKGINSTPPLSPHTTLPAQVLLNKSVNIIPSSDLDILKGYNPTIRTRRIFFLFSHYRQSYLGLSLNSCSYYQQSHSEGRDSKLQ